MGIGLIIDVNGCLLFCLTNLNEVSDCQTMFDCGSVCTIAPLECVDTPILSMCAHAKLFLTTLPMHVLEMSFLLRDFEVFLFGINTIKLFRCQAPDCRFM